MLASIALRAAPVAAAALLVLSGSALAAQPPTAVGNAPWLTDGFADGASAAAPLGRSAFRTARVSRHGQHGTNFEHLPAVRENIELVGKLEMKTPDAYKRDPETDVLDPSQPDTVPGQIADLAVYKNAAYLMSWAEPSCARGGFFSVDISNPAQPKQLAFVPALPGTYHGEGAQALTINTPSFSGDLLAVNNEPCSIDGSVGFDLYDVTNPAAPVTLVQGKDDESRTGTARSGYHSVFVWQDGAKAYLVATDNSEQSTTDVDIFDITNPRVPKQIGDFDLKALADAQGVDLRDLGADGKSANGNAIFNHDMIVKKIGAVQTMLVSYWDAGYVKINVNDPANPRILGDSAYDDVDPLTGMSPPEGNGHQAEFSHDNRFVLAADEDFSTYRTDFDITTGPNAGRYDSGEFGFTKPIKTLPDQKLNGPTVYGGYGCTAGAAIPAADTAIPPGSLGPGEEQIVVLQRGPVNDPSNPYPACRFDEKIQNAANAGYDGVIIANHHAGAQNGAAPDAAFCGSGESRPIPGMCIGHRAFHLVFNDAPDYDADYTPNSEPAIGTTGEKVQATSLFDGWGYMQLYRNTGNDLERVDSFAIEEALDERYASGFGDLSVHEWATDPTHNVGYSAYYAGGMRVFLFGDDGLKQTGKFIDEGGSNFWGVEVFTKDGERLFAGSDRDYGLYVLRYTGPGAPPPATAAGGGGAAPGGGGAAPGGAAARPLKSGGCENAITATRGPDMITGTEGSDLVRAGDGDDVVDGLGADDCLFGDNGEDVLDGGSGSDRLDGGAGADKLIGADGPDALFGGLGVDRLEGGPGNDRLSGGARRDILSGGGGRDVLFGGRGEDAISGGRGNDRIFGGAGRDRIYGNAGSDRITPGRGEDRVIAAGGDDVIFARDGAKDRISCGSGRDTVYADRIDVVTGCERVFRR